MPTEILLIPVDGSPAFAAVIEHLQALRTRGDELTLHLLNVQIPVESGHARRFVSREALEAWYQAESVEALRPAVAALAAAGFACTLHHVVGHPAASIVAEARALGCTGILMATHPQALLRHWLLGSVAEEVATLSPLPVVCLPA